MRWLATCRSESPTLMKWLFFFRVLVELLGEPCDQRRHVHRRRSKFLGRHDLQHVPMRGPAERDSPARQFVLQVRVRPKEPEWRSFPHHIDARGKSELFRVEDRFKQTRPLEIETNAIER